MLDGLRPKQVCVGRKDVSESLRIRRTRETASEAKRLRCRYMSGLGESQGIPPAEETTFKMTSDISQPSASKIAYDFDGAIP